MKFTIITSTYNASKHFERLADSISRQNYKNIEWIIIDGGSTDGTLDLITKYKNIISFYISESDQGIYDAWNKALIFAKGDWIIFLGADDGFVSNNILQNIDKKIKTIGKFNKIIYGQVLHFGLFTKKPKVLGSDWRLIRKKFNSIMSIPNPGIFYKSDLFKKYGNFDIKFKIAGDYEFLMRLIKDGVEPYFINDVLVYMGGDGISSVPHRAIQSLNEALLVRKKFNIKPRYPFPWCIGYLKAFLKLLILMIFGKKILIFTVNIIDIWNRFIFKKIFKT